MSDADAGLTLLRQIAAALAAPEGRDLARAIAAAIGPAPASTDPDAEADAQLRDLARTAIVRSRRASARRGRP
jgi:hypothetical protein